MARRLKASQYSQASINLSPKNLASFVQISQQPLLVQSDPSVETVIQDDITRAIAVAIDAAALAGTGSSNQPTGILATTGIGSVSFASAGAPTFAEIVAIESAISADNAMGANMAFVTTPALAGTLKTTTKDSGSGRFVSEDNSNHGLLSKPNFKHDCEHDLTWRLQPVNDRPVWRC